MTIFRRIRGLIGCALLGAIPWALVGVATIFVLKHRLIPGFRVFSISSPISDNLYVAAAVFGAFFGAISGVVFGVLVLASERSRSVDKVRTRRFIAIGAVASAGVIGLLFGSVWVALGAGALGAASSASILWIARRATRSELLADGDEYQLPRGAT